jgi:hypothetical protein
VISPLWPGTGCPGPASLSFASRPSPVQPARPSDGCACHQGHPGVRGGLYAHPTRAGDSELDYASPLPDRALALYYRVDDEDKPVMLPADVGVLDDRGSATGRITSGSSWSNAQFVAEIRERDQTCVLYHMHETRCNTAHLVAYNEGDAVRAGLNLRPRILLLTLSSTSSGSHSAIFDSDASALL